jgi:hypothetical protein
MPPHVCHGLRGLPPGCDWSVTDFWSWDAHEVWLRCPDEVDGDGVPGGALNLNSTNYPNHGHYGESPLSRKNPHGTARNRTWDLMISSQKHWPLDHKAGRTSNLLSVLFLTLRCVTLYWRSVVELFVFSGPVAVTVTACWSTVCTTVSTGHLSVHGHLHCDTVTHSVRLRIIVTEHTHTVINPLSVLFNL